MPFNINRVVVVGRLTRDPDLRALPSGASVCDLRIAVNSARKDPDGEWTEKPNYFDVSIFGARAETVASYMHRGSRVGVDGRLDWREWETDEQTKRQAVSIIADTVQFLDGRETHSDDGDEGDPDLAGVGAQDGDLAF
jgi:single-strand DNA-binding protein